jgi:cell division protein FtsA
VPVRIGVPTQVSGLVDVVRNPIYSTGVGLLLYGSKHQQESGWDGKREWGTKSMWQRMKSWFMGNY